MKSGAKFGEPDDSFKPAYKLVDYDLENYGEVILSGYRSKNHAVELINYGTIKATNINMTRLENSWQWWTDRESL